MAVYLLHSTVPLTRPGGREVRHYLGWTPDGHLEARLEAHNKDRKSAKIVQAFLNVGGELHVGNYWPGLDRDDERRMKRNGHLEAKCLICERNRIAREITRMATTAGLSKRTHSGPY